MHRKIIHMDMDAFYASVEQLDKPSLGKKPVIVGGITGRGVVCAASYEARKFGVRSAMPMKIAREKCPHGVYLEPRMGRYKEISNMIMEILQEYTDLIEPLSLDEAYLDVTENKKGLPYASIVAREAKKKIRQETGLTASAGAGPSKFIAKLASDHDKPDGIVVVPPEKVWSFISGMEVGKIPGVGLATESRLREMGIFKIKDLAEYPVEKLHDRLGKHGLFLSGLARGVDERPVYSHREIKSIGEETTFDRDLLLKEEIVPILSDLAGEVERRLIKNGKKGRTVTLKVKTGDFRNSTRSRTLPDPVFQRSELLSIVNGLIPKTSIGRERVRLVGITVSNFFKPAAYEQLRLFD
ncbi:MAG: DNA polymerase IV [Nitrospinae bacterium]|nr:DNA polymerase IV [Nitrospinota bacterium]